MKNVAKFLVIAIIFFFTTGSAIAGTNLKITTYSTPEKELRFTTTKGEYIASFQTVLKRVNYVRIKNVLKEHFSKEIGHVVEGSIWENTKEKTDEIMFYLYDTNNNYIGMIKISTAFFRANDTFIYKLSELQSAIEEGFGEKLIIQSIRERGNNSLPKYKVNNGRLLYFL